MCNPSPIPVYKRVIRVGGAGPVALADQPFGRKVVIRRGGGHRKIVTFGGQGAFVSTSS